jgi:hypothetical protein
MAAVSELGILHNYRLYGLHLATPLVLAYPEATSSLRPQLLLLPDDPCIVADEELRNQDGEFWTHCERDGWDVIQLSETCRFRVAPDRKTIRYSHTADFRLEALRSYLLASPLSFVLLERGIESLHATGVVLDGTAFGILGNNGYGKSTLAAALLSRGLPLLTDDLLVLEWQGETCFSHRSGAHIKLFPQVAQRFLPGLSGVQLNRHTQKSVYSLTSREVPGEDRVPLSVLYELEVERRSQQLEISPLPPAKAFIALLRNLFNEEVTRRERLRPQFEFCERIAANVPVFSLTYPKSLDALPQVAAELIQHVRSITLAGRQGSQPSTAEARV